MPLTYDSTYNGLAILSEPNHGSYVSILEAIQLRLQDMVNRHGHVLGLLLDLSLPWNAGCVPDNGLVQAFMGRFVGYLNTPGLGGPGHHYVWVRSQPAPDAQPHWHVLVLDSYRTCSLGGGHLEVASRLWGEVLGGIEGRGLVSVCHWSVTPASRSPSPGSGGILIQRDAPDFSAAYGLLFARASHLASAREEGFAPAGLRRFSASHLL
jgi:hypothetical protein